jgi:tRNA/rRNA methyltransferase
MAGSGTDKTKNWIETPGPVLILVEPQLGENIGAAARAMLNCGLTDLRLVRPRDGWPNIRAKRSASGADRILDAATLHDTVEDAIADCTIVLATTARAHDQAKPVIGAEEAARVLAPHVAAGETVGVLFGRERYGLENQEVALADRIVTLPVNPAFASLNLAQAVVILAYEWFKLAGGGVLPFAMPQKSAPAPREQLHAFFDDLERELEKVEFFRPAEKHDTMSINLRNIFHRMAPTQQDIQTLHGVILAIAEGRKGPAKGGVLDSEEAQRLRAVIAEYDQGRAHSERAPVRGLARLLRRNPTDAERILWNALTKDRRFAGHGFKRQTPIGRHIVDFVSFELRLAIEVIPGDESDIAANARTQRRTWLEERGYLVMPAAASVIENDLDGLLAEVASILVARLNR